MATCAIGGASHCGYVPKTKLRSSANSSQKRTLILSGYGIGPELFRKCGTEMKYKRCTADPSKPKVLVKGANKSLMNQRITRQLNYFPSSAVMLDSCGYEPTFCRPALCKRYRTLGSPAAARRQRWLTRTIKPLAPALPLAVPRPRGSARAPGLPGGGAPFRWR